MVVLMFLVSFCGDMVFCTQIWGVINNTSKSIPLLNCLCFQRVYENTTGYQSVFLQLYYTFFSPFSNNTTLLPKMQCRFSSTTLFVVLAFYFICQRLLDIPWFILRLYHLYFWMSIYLIALIFSYFSLLLKLYLVFYIFM